MIHRQFAENIGQDFSKDIVPQFWKCWIFIPTMSRAAAKPFNACWRPDSEEDSKTKSSVKSNQLIFHLPFPSSIFRYITLIGSAKLAHPVRANYENKR